MATITLKKLVPLYLPKHTRPGASFFVIQNPTQELHTIRMHGTYTCSMKKPVSLVRWNTTSKVEISSGIEKNSDTSRSLVENQQYE